MNLAEALLQSDAADITKKAEKDYEVNRLSRVLKVPFILHLEEIPPKRMAEIQSLSFDVDRKGHVRKGDLYTVNMLYLCDGITNPEFSSKEILKKFQCATKKEFLGKLLSAGEISDIAGEIQRLSGFDEDEGPVDTVKN